MTQNGNAFVQEEKMINKKKCPLIENPHENCYCFDLRSCNVALAVEYCLHNFTECERYKKNITHLNNERT